VRIWSKERHLAVRIATIGAERVGFDETPDREAVRGLSLGETVRCWLMSVAP
jgi:hypothetical protein